MTAFDDGIQQLAQRIAPGSSVLRSWPLEGGVSARVTAIEVRRPDAVIARWVVRQHGEADRRRNPQVAAHEFRLLQFLQAAGIPAPAPLHLEPTGAVFGTPCIVLDHIEGETGCGTMDREDCLGQLAGCLRRIHGIDGTDPALAFLPRAELPRAQGAAPENPPVLLHGDFWPGNVVFRDGRLAGVIDWEDAATGDPLADLAIARLEILWAHDRDAMERLTALYLAGGSVDPANLAHWDRRNARRQASLVGQWGLEPATLETMREKTAWMAAWAAERLGDRRAGDGP